MNWLKYLVGLSAIIVAGCAAYFSVTGLGVLFAGASISVMIMAGSLEFAKLVAATYLKQTWDEIKGFNKWYLTISVGILMMITSAGIFGYLSNAFQTQSLQLQQVDREVLVFSTKIEQNTAQITQLNTQLGQLSSTQSTILEKGKVNSRLLRSIDQKDRQVSQINKKISDLQDENAKNNEKINEIKVKNVDLEKEVGGFRFIAEVFGMELKNVVKFFIFLIVIVFDPLAIALIIAFNGLISDKKAQRRAILTEMMENDQKMGLYEVYGDRKDDLVENNLQKTEVSGKNLPIEDETPIIVENLLPTEELFDAADLNKDGIVSEEEKRRWYEKIGWKDPYDGRPYYQHPWFDWNKRERWINDRKAIEHWLKFQGGSQSALEQYKNTYPDDFSKKTY
jgi:hypothetical protein